jgi:predicted  nucleic acid-binding Zn-ribbon protein
MVVALAMVAYQVRLRQIELAALSGEFAEQQRALQHAETDIEDVDGEVAASAAALRALDAHISAIEREYPDGIPADEYDKYRRLVRERNAAARDHNAVIERHQALVRDYEQGVDRYNSGVAQANDLATRSAPGSVARQLWNDLVASVAGE